MRGAVKVPSGKLVAVDVERDAAGRVTACRVSGDFFVEGQADALLTDIATALTQGQPVADVLQKHPDTQLIGVDAAAIETAYARALGEQCDSTQTRARTDAITHADWPNRWHRLARELQVVLDEPRSPADQMVIDEQWAREVAQGQRPATLRFWQWSAPAVVVGQYQSIPDEVNLDAAQAEGFTVVRRCTGGGAMLINPAHTITYSLVAPVWFVDGVSVEESYQLCDTWLIDTLHELGVHATFGGLNDIVASDGKIGGAAQRRFPGTPGALLHHVTLAYDFDAEQMVRVLNMSREKISDKAVKSAKRRVSPITRQTTLSREDLMQAMAAHVGTIIEAASRVSE